MKLFFSNRMMSRITLQRVLPETSEHLKQVMPARFGPMLPVDIEQFVQLALERCEPAEFIFIDELRYFCTLMTLFGHRFADDPRFDEISGIIIDPKEKARMRRTRPLVPELVTRVWGDGAKRAEYLAGMREDLERMKANAHPPKHFPSCLQRLDLFERWQPRPLDQAWYVANAEAVVERMRIASPYALDVCFWSIWILGIDFDENPQFAWLVRSIDKVGDDPQRRFRVLLSWLARLAAGNGSTSVAGVEPEATG